ncbi:hypothetical protein [Streptomyces sp. NPDC018693]|uniref:hypothetical protein n=1 Tax=unclassified Streptomyces TaxID=2593676 RepID=UPI0037B80C1A
MPGPGEGGLMVYPDHKDPASRGVPSEPLPSVVRLEPRAETTLAVTHQHGAAVIPGATLHVVGTGPVDTDSQRTRRLPAGERPLGISVL